MFLSHLIKIKETGHFTIATLRLNAFLMGLMHHHGCSRAEGVCSYRVVILQVQLCNLHVLFRLPNLIKSPNSIENLLGMFDHKIQL